MNNVVGQPFIFNGGLDVNFSVPGGSPSQLPVGRYPSSFLNQIFGIGSSLHVPGPGGADPSTYGVDSSGNFTFTTHIDTAYSTWHTPIGAIIHYFVDVRDKGAHRGAMLVRDKPIERRIGGTVSRLGLGGLLIGVLLLGSALKAENAGMEESLKITVQVFDGRSGKPLKDQHVLVFTGLSSNAVKSHAQHTGVTTDKDGVGMLMIYPSETQWLQVFTDGRVPCFPDPNQASFSVNEITSKGLVTPNNCSAFTKEATPGHFVVFARPAGFMEKMKQ